MKLQSVSVIFVLGIAGMVNGLCLVKNTTTPGHYWHQCFRSVDYLADLNKSPIDVYGHTVSNSKIQVIRNGSYSRLGKSLKSLSVIYCGVEEIEDNAFQGLDELYILSLIGNKLEIIKSAWFNGLSSLKGVSFQNNQIKHVEDNFFSILPSLDILDISNNKLTCIRTASFGDFKTTELHFRHNRLSWTCQVLIMDWLKRFGVRNDFLLGNTDPPYQLAEMCVIKLPSSRIDEELVNKCTEDTTRQLLPATGSYTVAQVCEYLKGKHSPFLDCTK